MCVVAKLVWRRKKNRPHRGKLAENKAPVQCHIVWLLLLCFFNINRDYGGVVVRRQWSAMTTQYKLTCVVGERGGVPENQCWLNGEPLRCLGTKTWYGGEGCVCKVGRVDFHRYCIHHTRDPVPPTSHFLPGFFFAILSIFFRLHDCFFKCKSGVGDIWSASWEMKFDVCVCRVRVRVCFIIYLFVALSSKDGFVCLTLRFVVECF